MQATTNRQSRFPALDRATAAGLWIVVFGLLARYWLVWALPTIPVSDFQRIVEFAAAMFANGPTPRTWHWTLLSPGTSALLSPLLAIPGDDATVARAATATMMGLIPLVPLFLLRGVVPSVARIVVVGVLALLPALWVFSPVVAQDNWVCLPMVALACMAVRNARGAGRPRPVVSSLLFCLAVYIRQEMLIAALPLALLAALPWAGYQGRSRALTAFSLAAVVLLGMVAVQRYAATDRFALTTDHGGASMLGSYVPGARFGWIPYETHAVSVDPSLAGDPPRMMAAAGGIAWREIARRPLFHLERRIGALLQASTASDGTLVYWSLFDDAQAAANRDRAEALAGRVQPWVQAGLVLLHALFLAALAVGWARRDPAVLAIGLVVAAKAAIHLVFATQARFFLVTAVLETVAVGLALGHLMQWPTLRRRAMGLAAASAAVLFAIVAVLPRWEARFAEPETPKPSYFTLQTESVLARCERKSGTLLDSTASTFSFQVANADPTPGEVAEIHCRLRARQNDAIVRIELADRYAPGGFADRMFQELVVDGQIVRNHDIAADAWDGWWPHEIQVAPDRDVLLIARVRALRPDPGPAWGNAAATDLRVSDVSSMQ